MQESVFNVVLITFYSYIGIRILALKNYISCQEENCMLKKQLTMLNSQLGEWKEKALMISGCNIKKDGGIFGKGGDLFRKSRRLLIICHRLFHWVHGSSGSGMIFHWSAVVAFKVRVASNWIKAVTLSVYQWSINSHLCHKVHCWGQHQKSHTLYYDIHRNSPFQNLMLACIRQFHFRWLPVLL